MQEPTPEERAQQALQLAEVADLIAAAGEDADTLLAALASAIRAAVNDERRVLIDQIKEAGRDSDSQGADPYAGLAFRDAAMLIHARLGDDDAA